MNKRPLRKFAAPSQILGRDNAQNRGVPEVHEDSSTDATHYLAEAAESPKKSKEKRQKRLVFLLSFLAVGMLAFGFALVPIYNSLCKNLGINGKTNPQAIAYEVDKTSIARDREVLVEFVATNNSGVPWAFYPKTKKIKVHPGELVKLAFYAENKTDHRMTVQAIPSVTPGIAAKFLKKTECFCFTQQSLNGHEAMNMPLLFHLDADLPENINTVTLSYTLFDVTDRVNNA